MALRWRKSGRLREGDEIAERGSTIVFDRRWLSKMIINGIGALCTFMVMGILL